MTRIYIKEGYQWFREYQLIGFNEYKNFVEAGGRGRDFKWGDFIPELYLKSNEEHPVDAPVAPVPAAPAPGAASASGEVVSPELVVQHHHDDERDDKCLHYLFNHYKNVVEAAGRGHDFKWGDFIPELYLKSNEEHRRRLPVDAPVAPEPPVPAVPAPGAASASGEVVSPELVVQHHHDDERDECGEIVSVIRRVRRRSM
jgi:hypothetical protein